MAPTPLQEDTVSAAVALLAICAAIFAIAQATVSQSISLMDAPRTVGKREKTDYAISVHLSEIIYQCGL